MKRVHALILAVAIGLAVVLGSFAALHTTRAASPATVSNTQVATQNRALDRAEAALRAELRRRPPAITAAPAPRAQTVIYHRPPPVVHVVHRHGGEGGNEHEGGEGLDD